MAASVPNPFPLVMPILKRYPPFPSLADGAACRSWLAGWVKNTSGCSQQTARFYLREFDRATGYRYHPVLLGWVAIFGFIFPLIVHIY